MPKSDDVPVQHTPKHLEDDNVFDRRHPAASAFAVAQPAAGVVADDVAEKGQNLRDGETATEANKTFSDQKEVLEKQHEESLKAAAPVVAPTKVEGDKAVPAKKS